MKRQIQSINLNLVVLDQENVRFGGDVAQSQREAIELLMADPEDGKKILRLAEHIAQHGLDPTELQLVTPTDNESFIVLEGNRRLTALKLLQKPDLCPDEKLLKGFINAQRLLNGNLPSEIECSVVKSRSAGDMWIELKHTGQNNGVGRVGWDSDIRDERRARQTGIDSVGRQIRNIIKNNQGFFSKQSLDDVLDIPVTTLTRLFSSKPAQEMFHLKIENRQLVPLVSLEFIAPAVEYAIDLFSKHGYNVNDIRSADDRKRFIDRIPEEIHPTALIAEKNNKSTSENGKCTDSKSSAPVDGSPSMTDTGTGGNPSAEPSETSSLPDDKAAPGEPKIRARPSSRARKYLLPWSLSISNSRINEIYRELRKDIEVDQCPNATAIAFRVFIEVTCDEYVLGQKKTENPVLRTDNKKPVTESDTLETKVKAVVQHLESMGLLDKKQAKAIAKRAGTHDQVGSVDHFNQFIHSAATPPIPSELKDIADEYRPMFEAIWK
ncbi:hypothetical protein [Thauera aromatica]|uniref:hypothetical protein n=1 Tax=Thauera aromatica TaxID=59405 RepID=UPI001FFDE814|nr:hypothetical protein [Thauera aromatica]MCK2097371.1 hypothetical protein [Thauera aromatica]